MAKTKNEVIKITPLGGVGEIGKNMCVIEVDEEIFIIDAGLMFPENEMLGIDIVIPDITYLEDNKDRVKGIILTHGHEDAIGALPYVLRKIKAPVYGTKLTLALAKEKLKELGMKMDTPFYNVKQETKLKFDGVEITFFHTTHSIPDSVGVCIHTSEGHIVHTGDFKFDYTVPDAYKSDISKMAALGKEGVLCLLSDSSAAEIPGNTTSEAVIGREISSLFQTSGGRIIVALFASNMIRLQQVLDASAQNGRKVVIAGRSVERSLDIALKYGYLQVEDKELFIPIQEMSKYPDHQITVISAGTMGEPIEALQKMARQAHKYVNIHEGDTVLIAATPSPGLETTLFKTIDLLYRAGAVVSSSTKKVHVSGHGSQEDLKLMISLMNPKYFIPIQGEYKMLVAHSRLAAEVGVEKDDIFIIGKGESVEYKKGKMSYGNRVTAGNVLIDGIGVGDVGNIVLRDRKLLSQDGIFTVVVTLNKRKKTIAAGPEIISRGFVYVRESEKLMDESARIVKRIVEDSVANDTFEWSSIKQDIRDQLNQYLYEKTKRRPMILPIIMEV